MYSRRKTPEPDLVQVQNSDPTLEKKVRTNPNAPSPHISDSPPISNYDLPIALRKRTKECAKHPSYPLPKLSFHRFSASHRSFLANLHTIPNPSTLSEALSNK